MDSVLLHSTLKRVVERVHALEKRPLVSSVNHPATDVELRQSLVRR